MCTTEVFESVSLSHTPLENSRTFRIFMNSKRVSGTILFPRFHRKSHQYNLKFFDLCATKKSKTSASTTKLTTCIIFSRDMMQINLLGPLQLPICNMYALTRADAFSKYLFAVPLTNASADTVARDDAIILQ